MLEQTQAGGFPSCIATAGSYFQELEPYDRQGQALFLIALYHKDGSRDELAQLLRIKAP